MSILTLKDLEAAQPHEVDEAIKEVSVVGDLYAYLEWLNSTQGGLVEGSFKFGFNKKRSLGFHPSAISKIGECPLKIYFDVTGEVEAENVFDFRSQLIFDLGTCVHSMLQTYFIDMYGDQFDDEVPLVNKPMMIYSHADGRFDFPTVRFILEIKTIKEGGNFGYEKIQDRPFPDNVRQMMTYMHLDGCPFGLLFYFNKNTSEVKEHPLVYQPDIWESIREDMAPIEEAVENGERPVPKVGYHCKRCRYYHGCEAGRNHKKNGRLSKRRAARRVGARGPK